MAEIFVIARDTDADFPVRLVNLDSGQPVPVDDTYALSAKVWIGDDQSALFSPPVLLDGDAPTADLVIRISRSATAALEPGDYLFQGYVDHDSFHKQMFGDEPAILRITPSPGSDTPRIAWVTADDLRGYNSEVDRFLDANSNQSGFREERADATEDFKRGIVDRYMARPGYARRRGATYHPIHGYDVPDYVTPPPTKAAVRAALDANGLALDSVAKEIIAKQALHRIFSDELTNDPRNNPYRAFAGECLADAERLFASWQATVHFEGSPAYDAIIDRDVTFLSGT